MIEDHVRDKSKAFPTLAQPDDVTALRVWFCNYRTLQAISELTALQVLVIAEYPDEDLAALASLKRLEYLRLLHFPKVTNLDPLAELPSLKTLRLSSLPSWDSSGKVIQVASIAPIAQLPRLEHLELFGVQPVSRSLADLEASQSLRTVRVSKFPKAEVARYRSVTGISDSFAPDPPGVDWP